MKYFNLRQLLLLLTLSAFLTSCKKDWLDAKPDQKLVVPTTIKDLQSLLDFTDVLNTNSPNLGELGSDDYYLTSTFYPTRSDKDRNVYIWTPGDVYGGQSTFDWTSPYQQVYYANTVLEGVEKIEITPQNQISWNNIKGSALFYRSNSFFNLAQVFCKPYLSSTANSDLGIILRTSSDINILPVRSTIEATYNQILADLKEAKNLLAETPLYKTRPSKQAACGLLARTYLSMGKYDSALVYASECLQIYNTLIDFNTVAVPTGNNTFTQATNSEIIYLDRQGTNNMLTQPTNSGIVDSVLFQLYSANDLRKDRFFKTISGRLSFVGSYYGASFCFSGLATDEIYLIRAECNARKGNLIAAMKDLNDLLRTRWKKVGAVTTYVDQTAVDMNDALSKILPERRKELCFRGIRWSDLRRLNKDPQFAITLKHGLLLPTGLVGIIYTLPPNDNKYIWPIPDNEIFYSGIQQNPR